MVVVSVAPSVDRGTGICCGCGVCRSNVGKSSLLNMVCNRKDLAYVSKRPGKTQQFNYFVVNENTRNAFYLVDIPGEPSPSQLPLA